MFLPRFNFPEETFSRIGHKVAKHVLVKISSMKISYNIYNIYNRNLRNDTRCLEKDRVVEMILATFLSNIFFLVFYINIHPSCSKIRTEYFNIKIRLLFRET